MALQRLRGFSTASLLAERGLLLVLRHEIINEHIHELTRELNSQSFKEATVPSGFSLEHDAPRSQDVLLRQRDPSSGESVVVSALLGPLRFSGQEDPSQEVCMKVCVQKPTFGPVMRFDCCVFDRSGSDGGDSSDFDVKGAWYHSSVRESGIERKYLGPEYSTLDPNLQQAFKEYLVSRGVTTELTDFLLKHLHNKEHGQYVNWLGILKAYFEEDS